MNPVLRGATRPARPPFFTGLSAGPRNFSQPLVLRSDSWKLFYNTAGQLISEVGIAGTLNGLRVTNAFDEYLRRTNPNPFESTHHASRKERKGRKGTNPIGEYQPVTKP